MRSPEAAELELERKKGYLPSGDLLVLRLDDSVRHDSCGGADYECCTERVNAGI
jgi:hypothetical protein